MTVKIEEIRLGYSPLSENIFAGKLNKKEDQWLHKKNVSIDFISCVIQKYRGVVTRISSDDGEYEITVKKIK